MPFSSGYYTISLPVGLVLMFDWGAGMGVVGIWIGQLLAQALQSLAFFIYVFCFLDWNEEVEKAAMRQKLASNRPFPEYGCGEAEGVSAEDGRSEVDPTEAESLPQEEADANTYSDPADDERIFSKEKSQSATLLMSLWEEKENKLILKKLVTIFFFVIVVLSLGITGNILGGNYPLVLRANSTR